MDNDAGTLTSEVLILPDGQILVHDLTPTFTEVLHGLNPDDPHFAPRQAASVRLAQKSFRNKTKASRKKTRTISQTRP